MISIHVPECTWKWPTLSNEAVLTISISLFLLFSVSQLIGALVSDSLALLGDSICMFVDVASYMCNTYVEWYKARHGRITFGSRVFTELIVPSLSVLSLLAVTIYITYDAIVVLEDPPINDTVNVDYLYAFASVNLLVDIGCNLLFYMKGEDAFQEEKVSIPQLSLNTSLAQDADDEFGKLDEDEFDWRITPSNTNKNGQNNGEQEARSICSCATCFYMCRFPTMTHVHGANKKSNLNMLSAFTHILGDTFRTLSTFLAAMVSSISGIDGDICDAWAAIVVTVTIILLSIMLLNEIKDAALEIWHEDCSETMSSHAASYPDGAKKAKVSSSNHIYRRLAENDTSDNDSMIVI